MASDSGTKHYVVRFEGNKSKRWDGKEVWLDAEVLDELYDATELVNGANVVVPFRGKGGKITHWNAVFVENNKEPPEPAVAATTINEDPAAAKPSTKNNNGMYTIKLNFNSIIHSRCNTNWSQEKIEKSTGTSHM